MSDKSTAQASELASAKSTLASLPAPRRSARSDVELDQSTQHIYGQLRLLQADDIVQLGKARQLRGDNPLSQGVSYWKLIVANVREYLHFLWATWSLIPTGLLTRQLSPIEAVVALYWAAWTSAGLFLMLLLCTFATAPLVQWFYNRLFRPSSGGLSLVNSANPHLFESLNQEQAQAGKTKLGMPVGPNASNPRVFDLDIAKWLLQLSALMYERDRVAKEAPVDAAQKCAMKQAPANATVNSAKASDGPAVNQPGAILHSLLPSNDAQLVLSTLQTADDDSCKVIKQFCKEYGICFHPASELRTTNQAYCSLFWDPTSTWVVVAFKGTDPISFDEWTTDFTAIFEDCSADIPGFHFVHKGFKDRILPDDVPRQPFTDIALAVQTTCGELIKGQPEGTKVNVWFTGHSLGTAMASLAYAKALSDKGCFGPHALIRDAYAFATPVSVDITSRLFFDTMMLQDEATPRTLFRVTNRNDFVATGIPQFGDDRMKTYGADNLFNFCHLGVELYMKKNPDASQVFGDAVRAPAGYSVVVQSIFAQAENHVFTADLVKKGWVEAAWMNYAQYIPILGSLAAHSTTNYWAQLEVIGQLPCVLKA